jgi:VIT1/CCC1 family predicted Fe2+/Mn2+ transporter
MHGQQDRIEQFKAEISELRIKDPSAPRDPMLARAGAIAMAVGVVLPIVAYFLSHGTDNALQQRDALVIAVLGASLTVAGGALYLKASIANFLRFWLLRDLHERRAQTDRLLAGREDPAGPGTNP